MASLRDMLDAGAALEKRAALASDPAVRDALLERRALVDVAAFGLFKKGDWSEALRGALPALGKGLGWGVGLGLPALAVGHGLLSDARGQARDVVHDARNQVLLTGLGLGGMHAVGQGLGRLVPQTSETTRTDEYPGGDIFRTYQQSKMSADRGFIEKLAALVVLDDFLERRFNETGDKEAGEVLVRNREVGAAMLREALL